MQDKDVMRKQVLALRNGLPQAKRQRFSHDIMERFFDLEVVQEATTIMLFLAFGSEVDTWLLLERGVELGKLVVAPICLPATKELALYPINSRAEAVPGHWGILEPSRIGEAILPEDLDVVVVPGLAFDGTGRRIGYGGGYYDRFLPKADCACKVGVCFDVQLVERVPSASHDVPVDVVITEKRVIWRTRGPLGEGCARVE
ncbi:MAG: 5-formyltetrahydrofolate cyclo-ligase [Firmicutes bacterium]|nr:5-formyltetrahydrofolate cyclo-ligase [Bacillota bacterium]